MSEPTTHLQKSLLRIADEIARLDRRLGSLADTLEPGCAGSLTAVLAEGAHCVRSDLLSDAVATLTRLGEATEEDVRRRRLEVETAAGRIAAFG